MQLAEYGLEDTITVVLTPTGRRIIARDTGLNPEVEFLSGKETRSLYQLWKLAQVFGAHCKYQPFQRDNIRLGVTDSSPQLSFTDTVYVTLLIEGVRNLAVFNARNPERLRVRRYYEGRYMFTLQELFEIFGPDLPDYGHRLFDRNRIYFEPPSSAVGSTLGT